MDYIEIPILYVAHLCGIQTFNSYGSDEVPAQCPFCDDRKRHMSLNIERNQYRCNRCNTSGNSLTLYAKIYGINNNDAFKALISNQVITSPLQLIPKTIQKPQHVMKPLHYRHDVYYDMLNYMELSNEHYANLYQRGMSDTAINQYMYRTLPEENSICYNYVLEKLTKEYDLSEIPGFYCENGRWKMLSAKGFLIPMCNHEGFIQGFQIRLDNAVKNKYIYFSSRRHSNGTKAESWIHISNWNWQDKAYLIEGPLKSQVCACFSDELFIAVPGVSSIQYLQYALLYLGIKEVINVFDMDKFVKPNVIEAVERLNEMLNATGIKHYTAKWNPKYNGLDEFYLAKYQYEMSTQNNLKGVA